MFKRFKYTFLMVAALMLSYTSIFSQDLRQEMRDAFSASYEFLKSDPEKAVKMAAEAYDLVKDSDDEYIKMVGFTRLGHVSYRVRDYESAYLNYTEALDRLEKLDTVDLYSEFSILQNLGLIHSKFNNHDQSIVYRKQSLEVMKEFASRYPQVAKEKGALPYLNSVPYFLAVEYEKKGSHQTAGKILMDLWEEAEDKEDIVTHARVLNRLGLIKKNNGEYNDAIEYFALVAFEPEVADSRKAIALQNLGETYLKQGELERAERHLLLALDLKKKIDNPRSTFLAYLHLGELEYQRNNMTQAIKQWETGLQIFDKVEGEPDLYKVYNKLQVAYMDVDLAKAKAFNEQFLKLNDFYVKNQTFQREEEAQRREALSMLIDKEKQRRVDAQQRQQFIKTFWPVFLGVGLLALFSIILGIRYYKALRANRALSQTQLKLERAKEILKSVDSDLD